MILSVHYSLPNIIKKAKQTCSNKNMKKLPTSKKTHKDLDNFEDVLYIYKEIWSDVYEVYKELNDDK